MRTAAVNTQLREIGCSLTDQRRGHVLRLWFWLGQSDSSRRPLHSAERQIVAFVKACASASSYR